MDIDEDFVEGVNDENSDSSEPNLEEEVDSLFRIVPLGIVRRRISTFVSSTPRYRS